MTSFGGHFGILPIEKVTNAVAKVATKLELLESDHNIESLIKVQVKQHF